MAKDYFEDIIPPAGAIRTSRGIKRAHPPEVSEEDGAEVLSLSPQKGDSSERSIRNIAVSSRQRSRHESPAREVYSHGGPRRSVGKWWLWGMALLGVLVVGALLLVALRPTRVTVTPRSHALSFSGEVFSALPSAEDGALSYSVETIELEDSEVVPSDGVVYAEDKASGNITVYNNYQATPLKLVKNTRFATASGLVFRAPVEIIVPAKKGSVPGSVEITVVADKAGQEYNVPAGKFDLPGLKSTPDMYGKVYAESKSPFSGGFVGERPGVAAGALEAAIATTRSRLEDKARESALQVGGETITFTDLAQIRYETLPNTTEAGGGVRVHQKAVVSIPVLPIGPFISTIARTAVGDTDPMTIRLERGETFAARASTTSLLLGADTLDFALSGSATLVWDVPESDLQKALAGKDRSAFESIVSTFDSIQEARAHIEPFWKDVFPEEAADIKITIKEHSTAE